MTIKFTKMHGLGNDFMVIDGVNQSIDLSTEQIKQWANRHTGIGFDQLLLVETACQDDCDFSYRIFNADGGEVGQCGNGARCLARFIHKEQLSSKKLIQVATHTNHMQLRVNDDNSASVYLSPPKFSPQSIPFRQDKEQNSYQIQFENQTIDFHVVNVGNPHAVILVDDINSAPVQSLGDYLCHHPLFPQQVNVGFMQLTNNNHIKLRVFERGAGETLACGSGAVAAAICAIKYHHYPPQVVVDLIQGQLIIEWSTSTNELILTGPAEFVFQGEIL